MIPIKDKVNKEYITYANLRNCSLHKNIYLNMYYWFFRKRQQYLNTVMKLKFIRSKQLV